MRHGRSFRAWLRVVQDEALSATQSQKVGTYNGGSTFLFLREVDLAIDQLIIYIIDS